jgi:hypothetical protein
MVNLVTHSSQTITDTVATGMQYSQVITHPNMTNVAANWANINLLAILSLVL